MTIQIEGRNPVLESLRAQQPIRRILIKDGIEKDEKITEIIKLARSAKVEIKYVPKKKLNGMSQTGIHQGVIAVRREVEGQTFKQFLNDTPSPFVVYIRESHNEYNIGSIIRTCEAAGVNALLLPPKIKLTEQMVRASMGASEHLAIINESVFNAIKLAKDYHMKVVGIETSGETEYYHENMTGPLMLIVGGEDRSLSESISDKCDAVVQIPMHGNVNSLNMGVATAVVIYHKLIQELAAAE